MDAFLNWCLDHALLPALVGGCLGTFVGAPLLHMLSRRDRMKIAVLRGDVCMHKAIAASEKRMSEFYRDMAQRAIDANYEYTERMLSKLASDAADD